MNTLIPKDRVLFAALVVGAVLGGIAAVLGTMSFPSFIGGLLLAGGAFLRYAQTRNPAQQPDPQMDKLVQIAVWAGVLCLGVDVLIS